MNSDFNPYREWLDLSTAAPNYYELLGLQPEDLDRGRIAAAAERAITRVRSFRPGPRARTWAQLLDEIRAAKDCLTNGEQKARYDDDLKRGVVRRPILTTEMEIETLTPALGDLPMALPVETSPSTWAAGPSPLYGSIGNHKDATGALPEALPVGQQPRTAIGLPEPRAVPSATEAGFASKTTTVAARRGSGWIGWAIIAGLTLLTIGLSYRLSVVARQRQAAEREAEAQQSAIQSEGEK